MRGTGRAAARYTRCAATGINSSAGVGPMGPSVLCQHARIHRHGPCSMFLAARFLSQSRRSDTGEGPIAPKTTLQHKDSTYLHTVDMPVRWLDQVKVPPRLLLRLSCTVLLPTHLACTAAKVLGGERTFANAWAGAFPALHPPPTLTLHGVLGFFALHHGVHPFAGHVRAREQRPLLYLFRGERHCNSCWYSSLCAPACLLLAFPPLSSFPSHWLGHTTGLHLPMFLTGHRSIHPARNPCRAEICVAGGLLVTIPRALALAWIMAKRPTSTMNVLAC